MDRHVRKSPRGSGAVFWRRRVVFLLVAGVLLGMVFWPLNGWLFADGTPSDQASGDAGSGARRPDGAGQNGAGQNGAGQNGAGQNGAGQSGDGQNGDGQPRTAGKGEQPAERQGGKPEPRAGAAAGAAERGATEKAAGRPTKPDVGVCAGEDLTVTARAESENAPAGRPLTFRLTVRNGGDRPCRIPADPKHVRVAVLAGSERVLDTDRCPAAIDVRPPRVRPAKSGTVNVRWNGRRTASDCSADAPAAGPGTYSVQASVLGAFSAPAPFELRRAG